MATPLKRKPSDEPRLNTEEQYLRLFPKIGRDFVHKDDLAQILLQLFSVLGVDLSIDDVHARERALEYKLQLEAGLDHTAQYKDLIDLEDTYDQ